MILFPQHIVCLKNELPQPIKSEAGSFVGSDNGGRDTSIGGFKHQLN
ncbi:MAG: hypothetical protein R3E32_07145 [Chitinophagales bacterium]